MSDYDPDAKDRADYIKGLRLLADVLEASDIPLPSHGTSEYMALGWYVTSSDDEKAEAAAIVRALGGHWGKDPVGDELFSFKGKIAGLYVDVTAHREAVCTRRVVGTETVTEKVATAFEVQTVERDIVEWDCGSLLSAVTR